ncbi:Beta-ketoacyl-acyl-carrier-protein synthase II [Planctomycetales bacterium 10988]|nr:Beta-ketoacyl-acyl-carrier-protein synthase II [Planctomycetales bacterium 10988]
MAMIQANRPIRRVVITGLGVVTPIGKSLDTFWRNLVEGQSGVGPLAQVPSENYPFTFGGEAREFTGHISDFGEVPKDLQRQIKKSSKIMCREIAMGVASAQMALSHAGMRPGDLDPERVGVSFGTGYMVTMPGEFAGAIRQCLNDRGTFDFSRWGGEGMRQVTPLWLLKYLPNMPACHIAILNDFRGPNNSLTLGEVAANQSIGEAFHVVARGSADMMVAGATDSRLSPLRTVQTALWEELANDQSTPPEACRPFDRDRTGMVVGEGSGTVILEELESAKRRGATIYGEILGVGSSCVNGRDHVGQRETALANAMRSAMRQHPETMENLGHIHAHGLSTKTSDIAEARALHQVFRERTETLPVVAAKSHFGNLGAGSGAVELIASLMATRQGHLFPVMNYKTSDPECLVKVNTDNQTPAGDTFLNLSVRGNGQASCLLVRKWDE